MRRFRSLGARLLLANLAVVLATALTVLIAARLITPTFYRSHVRSMAEQMDGMTTGLEAELESGFETAFAQSLLVSVMIGVGVALLAAVIGAGRVVRPIDAVRRTTRRLAQGHYRERVEEPVEEELAALAADVNHLAEALEHTEERRLRLLGEVSHELRTPLTTIEGYMEAVLDGVLEPSADVIAAVAHEAGRLKRLAADIALLSRAEEATLELDVRDHDVSDLVAGVVARLRPQFDEKGVDLVLDAGSPAVVPVDADRITQVVTNLVGNALTYTPTGGSVDVVVHADPRGATVTVADTGRGIDPAETDRIFERFYRGDRSAPGGMGVGLSIARGIVRLHGGDVTVDSTGRGTGSTFTVRLPRAG